MPITLKSTGGGSVSIDVPSTGATFTLTAPANNATIFTTDGGAITGNVAFTSNNISIGGQTISPAVGMRNRIINGDMRIDQRNAGSAVTPTVSGTYINDRWRYATDVASKFTLQQQQIASPQSCDGNRYTLSASTASAYTPTVGNYFGVTQLIEGYNVADLAWGTSIAKPVTLQFWVYCGLTGTFGGAIRTGDGSNYSYPFSYTISAANTWEKKTITIPGPTAGTWGTTNGVGLDVWFDLGSGSTFQGTAFTWASANYVTVPGAVKVVSTASASGGNWYVTGVQLEQGTVATPFERRLYGTELALCQRYYYRMTETTYNAIGMCIGTTASRLNVTFPTQMRIAPTSLEQSGTAADYNINSGGSAITCSAVPAFLTATVNNALSTFTVASGLTAGNGAFGRGAGYLAWSAEL